MTAVAAMPTTAPREALKLTVNDMQLVRRLRIIERCLEEMFPNALVTSVPRRFDPQRNRQLFQIDLPGRSYAVDLRTSFVRDYRGHVEELFENSGVVDTIVGLGPIPLDDTALLALNRSSLN